MFSLRGSLAIILVSERRSISIVSSVILKVLFSFSSCGISTFSFHHVHLQHEMTNVNDEMTDVIIILILH